MLHFYCGYDGMIFINHNRKDFTLLQGDCSHILPRINDKSINMIFADPPYFLSNDGLTVKKWYSAIGQ